MRLSRISVCLWAIVLCAVHVQSVSYVSTPVGRMREDCVHTVPSGSSLHPLEKTHQHAFAVRNERGDHVGYVPRCPATLEFPMFESGQARQQPRQQPHSAAVPFPPDYDGWLSYTAAQDQGGFNSFLGYFSVPDNPQNRPDILYIFTGLQNIDWIPKADPQPSMPFDIIQPVLQYPSDWGVGWSVKSWYVTLDAGAVQTQEVMCQAGDNVFGNMTKVGDSSWFIDTVVNQKHTSVTVNHERLTTQPWAYTTVECYGCQGCGSLPQQPCKFTKMTLTNAHSQPTTLRWLDTPKPPVQKICAVHPIINGSTTLSYEFQP